MPVTSYQEQSSLEAKVYPLDFEMPAGVTLVSITVAHMPPTGASASVTSDVVSASLGTGNVYVPAGLVVGRNHIVSCLGVTDNVKVKPEIVLLITVNR